MPQNYGYQAGGQVGLASSTPSGENALKPVGYSAMQATSIPSEALSIPQAGLRVGVGPGASTEIRNFVQYVCDAGNYKRRNGVVYCRINDSNATASWLNRWIHISSETMPELEGRGYVTSCRRVGNQWDLIWQDADPVTGQPRGDSNGDPAGLQIADLASYSIVGGWLVHANRALGGRADFILAGTGSTNIFQWTPDRMQQFLARGPFDVIVLPFGTIGNQLLKIYNGNASTTFAQLVARYEEVVEQLQPHCRAIVAMTPYGNRNIPVNSSAYTLGLKFQEYLYRVAVAKFKNFYVAPTGELMGNNWQDPTAAENSDVMNNLPAAISMFSDGTHFSYGACKAVGAAVGLTLKQLMTFFAPEMGARTQTRAIASTPEPGGTLYSNTSGGQFGQVTTKAPDVGTGSQPANTTIAVANAGGATLVHSILKNPEGGWDWGIAITDATGSAAGATLTLNMSHLGGVPLVDILNAAANQGPRKRLRGVFPFGCRWAAENSVVRMEIGLYGTSGGTEYNIANFLSDNGVFSMGGTPTTVLSDGAIAAAGTGYSVGDVLTVSGGTRTQTAQITVLAVSGGAITRWYVSRGGNYSATPANAASVTGGTGSGATFNLNWVTTFRTMDWGFAGNLALPYDSFIPAAVYSAASLRIVMKLVGNALPAKTANLRIGAGINLAVEDL